MLIIPGEALSPSETRYIEMDYVKQTSDLTLDIKLDLAGRVMSSYLWSGQLPEDEQIISHVDGIVGPHPHQQAHLANSLYNPDRRSIPPGIPPSNIYLYIHDAYFQSDY
jgi:hypothetical protein